MSSAAKPVNQPDALRLLLDRIPRGADATLIAEGDAGDVLLDLVADCLSGQRIRVLRASEVLPSRLAAPTPSAKAGVPDDEALSRGFQALTVLDPACDRIVLLVGDAHALQLSALRYIQFASRAGAHLQLVFYGTRAVFDLLNIEEFAWLRTRLMAGLVLTLAAPVPEASDALPLPAPDGPEAEAWAGEDAAPPPGARRPAVPASRRPWPLLLGALALLGLGGAAGLMLGSRGGEAGRPAATWQAASVAQPPTFPDAPASGMPAAGAASQAAPATPDAPSLPPAMAGDAPGAGPRSPSSMAAALPPAGAPGSSITIRSQSRVGVPENEPRLPEPPPDLARPGRSNASAASSRAATAAPGSRARRLREARDQPPRDDQWAPSEPAFGSWTASGSQPPRYIGSYAADANGVRTFRPEP